MKYFSKLIWELYKNSTEGQKTISEFQSVLPPIVSGEELFPLAKKYDTRLFANGEDYDDDAWMKNHLNWASIQLKYIAFTNEYFKSPLDKEYIELFFEKWMMQLLEAPQDQQFDDIPQKQFKPFLLDLVVETWAMYKVYPDSFIPNLFAFQFHYLQRFAHQYEIELPKVPNRSNYKDRCWYYIELNRVLMEYAHMNGITKPEEVCAFWFGLALPLAKEAIENDRSIMPITPENAWLLVGNYSESEKNMKQGFWQANPMTRRGDVMIFYEMSPVMKINSVWQAMDDGVADPFFYYMGYTEIGNKIVIPDAQTISFQELKNNTYYQKRDKAGNYVSKNFQGCSGWSVTFEDYAEIKRLLEEKGFDTSVLPSLYEPDELSMDGINDEEDVYQKLVSETLVKMGWEEGKDFKREIEFTAGHTTTHHASNKRPDYCLHLSKVGNKIYTKVVIEAKFLFRNTKELEDCFNQCQSYADWGKAKVMVICDKHVIYVFEQDRNGNFNFEHHKTRYRWTQLKNHATFMQLKRQLSI